MHEFLLRIKAISDALAFVRSPISLQEQIDAILEGLLQDYHSVISVIESKFQLLPIEEVEALLLAHEARLLRFRKHTSESPSIDLTQVNPNFSSLFGSDSYAASNKSSQQYHLFGRGNFNRGSRCGGGGGGRGRGGGHFANFQCQVCYKYGHTASVCHYRFDQGYQPNPSLTLRDPSNQGNTQTNNFCQNQYSSHGNGSGQNNYGQNNGFKSSNSWSQGTN